MIIRELIRKYLEDFSQGRWEKPQRCKLCGKGGSLSWHSSYRRKVITLSGVYEIPIKRLYCRECRRTFGHLPPFILKYRRYGADVIVLLLEEKKRKTYEEVVSEASERYGLLLDVLTIWLWRKGISQATLRKLEKL